MRRIAVALLGLLACGTSFSDGAAPLDAAALAAAHEALRVEEAAWLRLHEEFERLLAQRRLSSTEAADYHAFLDELAGRVRAERERLARLESGPGAAGAAAPTAGSLPGNFDRGSTTVERIAALDAELGASLSAFDDKLLREQQAVAAKSRPAGEGKSADKAPSGSDSGMSGGGTDGASDGAADGSDETPVGDARRDGGSASGAGGGEPGGEHSTAGAPQGGGDAGGQGGGRGDGEAVGAGGGGDATRPSQRVPDDVGSGEDDDIVARQIREAAERESDPVLREKLWDEYRRYKGRGAERATTATR